MLSFKPTFSLSSFTFIRRLFSSSSLRYEIARIKGKISGLWDKSLKYEFIEPDKLGTLFGFAGKPFQKPQQIMLFPLKYRNPVLVHIRLHKFVCLSLPTIAISLFFYLYLHFRILTHTHTHSYTHSHVHSKQHLTWTTVL